MPASYLNTMQGETAPPASGSPYGDLMRASVDSERAKFASTATLSLDTDPDAAARARQVATYLGEPAGVVMAAPAEAERRARVKQLQEDSARAPTLRERYLDPEFARLAHDDSSVLSGIERVVRDMMSPRQRKPVAVDPIMSSVQFSDTVRRMVEANPALDYDTARSLAAQGTRVENGPLIGPSRGPAPTVGNVARGLFNADRFRAMSAGLGVAAADALGLDPRQQVRQYDVAKARSERNTPDFETSTGAGIYAGAESLVNNAPGIVLSVLSGNPLPGLALAGAQTSAESYGKYRSRGGTPGQAAAGAALEGGIEVATELMPMSFLVNKMGKAGAGEFIKGLLAREVPGEQLATLAQDAVDTAIANPDKTWGDYVRERPGAAYQTLLATLTQSGALGAVNVAVRKLAPQQEQAESGGVAPALEELGKLQAASKLAQRAPDTFAAFVQQITESGEAPSELYVGVEELANTLNQSGVDVAALRGQAPQLVEQLENAMPGADVRIPVGELAALGPQFTQPLLEHLRESPEAMSRAEAQQFMDQQGDKIKGEVEQLLAQREETTAFKQQVDAASTQFEQELASANRFRPEVNKAYASLLGNFYAVQALRAGMPLNEMLDTYQLRVTSQTPGGASTLQQEPAAAAQPSPELVTLRQRENVLQKLVECLGAA